MKRLTVWPARPALAVLVAVALAAVAGPSRAAPADEVAARTWVSLRSAHIEVVTDAGREVGERVAQQLELMHEAFATAAPGFVVELAPVQVLLFKDPSLFEAYAPRWKGVKDVLGGYFLPGPDRRRMLFAERRGRTQSVAQHEFTHALLEASLPELPLWLNEGLAEYWSTFRADGGKAIAGTPVQDHLEWLQRNDLMPLDRLFAITQASPDYHEGDRRGTFYAQSWALVHLLLSTAEDLSRLDRCLVAFRDGEAFDAAFAREFGPESGLRARLHAHLDRPGHRVREWGLLGYNSARRLEPRHPTAAEVLATLGTALLAHDPPQQEFAYDHLRRAVHLEPQQPEAVAGLGWLRLLQGRSDSALALFQRAMKREPVSVPAVRLAATEWPPFATKLGDSASRHGMVAALREGLGRSRAQAPKDPELIALLARTWIVQPGKDAETGYQLAQQAVALLPGRTDIRLDLLALAALTGRLEEARTLADKYFQRNTRPEAAVTVRRALFAGEVLEVNKLVRTQQYARADSALRVLRASAKGDAELEREADDYLAQLAKYRSELAAAEAENAAVVQFNIGVDLANAQKHRQAAEAFRRAERGAYTDSLKAKSLDMAKRMDVRARGGDALALAKQGRIREAIAIFEGLSKQPGIPREEKRWVDQNLAALRKLQGG
jgi:tetratricopeptide (TPR) repeat protein